VNNTHTYYLLGDKMLRTEEVRDFLEKSGKPVAFDNI
jgi:hypothetical protein